MKKFLILFVLFSVFACDYAECEIKRNPSSLIDSIFINPGRYIDESITVEGTIIQYVPEPTRSTAFYLIKSDYGSIVKVITSSSAPMINKRYRVNGIVGVSQNLPIIKEDGKVLIDITDIKDRDESKSIWQQIKENILVFVIILLVILALVVGIIYLILSRRQSADPFPVPPPPPAPAPGPGPDPAPVPDPTITKIRYDDSLQTVRMPVIADAPSTLKFIPVGKLRIESGPDTGNVLILSGYSMPDGVVLSIGRDSAGWKEYLLQQKNFNPNRLLSHILVKDPTSTLSRLQAELIYRNGQMFIKHHGSNPTIVDGVDMASGEQRQLNFESTIKAGAMVFKYIQ